ncbi:hypothetical protein BT93_L2747 [Corymbia citriodora subsp. variegata]|uniref:Uncharacterized protein n=1 Tax=Corymbia citriodora subsp. variegata TaxID=360336 RepID=A0A8T0CJ05_CORYI|nr:hypothetical protein BT93_L2747 [Corymbia citriodora subsp. variegata]
MASLFWQRRDALLVPEEVVGINRSFHFDQPLKIVIEVLDPVDLPFFVAVLAIGASPNVQISVVQEGTPWTPDLRQVILLYFGVILAPIDGVLNLEQIPSPVWERGCRRWDLAHPPPVRIEHKPHFPQFDHLLPEVIEISLRDRSLDVV